MIFLSLPEGGGGSTAPDEPEAGDPPVSTYDPPVPGDRETRSAMQRKRLAAAAETRAQRARDRAAAAAREDAG